MADTTEVICDVAYDYTQLTAGQTLFDLATNESLVIRDFTWMNPGRKALNLRLNGVSWRAYMPCDYSWRLSGAEIIQADAVATVSISSLPIFGNLMRFNNVANSYTLLGQSTVFTDQLTSSPQSVSPLGGTVSNPTISPSLAGPSYTRCAFFDASGNFYYTQGNSFKGAVYRRAGGLAGAETALFSGATVWFMAFDVESGILYAATSATTLKRYNTATSAQLADVTLASVPLASSNSSFTVRGGLMMSWTSGQPHIYFTNAATGASIGTIRYDTDGTSVIYPSIGSPFITKTSTGIYKAYFGYTNTDGNGETGLACINCGTAPLTTWSPTRVNRTGENLYNFAYNPQSQLWAELPYSNSYTQDLVLALDTDTGSNKTIYLFNRLTDTVAYKFTVPSLPTSGGALIALGSTAQAVADFGTVRCKITGIKTK